MAHLASRKNTLSGWWRRCSPPASSMAAPALRSRRLSSRTRRASPICCVPHDGACLCEWDREREWNRGRVRARGVRGAGGRHGGRHMCASPPGEEGGRGQPGSVGASPRGGAQAGAGRGGGFGIGFSFSWVGWRVPEPGDKIDKFIHKIWFPI